MVELQMAGLRYSLKESNPFPRFSRFVNDIHILDYLDGVFLFHILHVFSIIHFIPTP
jgi:hypothetical protein